MSDVKRFKALRTEYGPDRTVAHHLVECVLATDYAALRTQLEATTEQLKLTFIRVVELDTITAAHRTALETVTRERDDYKGQMDVGLQLTGSFFEALKPLKLTAIHVENPGRHVTDLIHQRDTLQARVTELEGALNRVLAFAPADMDKVVCIQRLNAIEATVKAALAGKEEEDVI